MEGEESDDALVGGAVVRGVLGLGLQPKVSPEVAEAGLRGEVLVRLEGVGRIGLQLRVGKKAFKGAV